MKIIDVIEELPEHIRKDYRDLFDKDLNYIQPAKFMWQTEPKLQELWPRLETFTAALCFYRRKKLKKVVR